jgi:hypothetical protein
MLRSVLVGAAVGRQDGGSRCEPKPGFHISICFSCSFFRKLLKSRTITLVAVPLPNWSIRYFCGPLGVHGWLPQRTAPWLPSLQLLTKLREQSQSAVASSLPHCYFTRLCFFVTLLASLRITSVSVLTFLSLRFVLLTNVFKPSCRLIA